MFYDTADIKLGFSVHIQHKRVTDFIKDTRKGESSRVLPFLRLAGIWFRSPVPCLWVAVRSKTQNTHARQLAYISRHSLKVQRTNLRNAPLKESSELCCSDQITVLLQEINQENLCVHQVRCFYSLQHQGEITTIQYGISCENRRLLDENCARIDFIILIFSFSLSRDIIATSDYLDLCEFLYEFVVWMQL